MRDHGGRKWLDSGERLPLGALKGPWRLESGQVTIHAGTRRLFTLAPGDVLVGTPAQGENDGFVAIARNETLLHPLPQSPDNTMAWAKPFGDLIADLAPLSGSGIAFEPGQFHLTPQKTYHSAEACWAMVVSGQAHWLGREDFPLAPETGFIPLLPGTWLTSESEAQVLVLATDALAPGQALAALGTLQRTALALIEAQKEAQAAQAQERLAAQAKGTGEALAMAAEELASTLGRPAGTPPSLTPLVAAALAVGRASGLTLAVPKTKRQAESPDATLAAIAAASSIRLREVALHGDWWQRDHGPMLAWRGDDTRPLALLPLKPGRYEAFDPDSGERHPVDETLAAQLNRRAIVFYRRLPERSLTWKDLLALAWAVARPEAKTIVLMAAFGAALGVVIPQGSFYLVSSALPDGNREMLAQIAGALALVATAQALFKMVQDRAVLRAEARAETTVEAAVWDRVLSSRLSFFRRIPSGDLAQRLGALGQMRRTLAGSTIQGMMSGAFSIAFLVQLFWFSVPMALAGLGIGLFTVSYMAMAAWMSLRAARREQSAVGQTQAVVVNLIDGVSKIRLARAEARAFATWARTYAGRERASHRSQEVQDRMTLFTDMLPLASASLFFGGFAAIAQAPGAAAQIGRFIAFSFAFNGFLNGAMGLGTASSALVNLTSVWGRLVPLLQAPLDTAPQAGDPGELSGAFRLQRVSFRYEPERPPTLKEVSLEVDAGELVAVVGASGAGKSTLLRLLLGLEQPIEGKVLFDGKDLTKLDSRAVRRQIGTVLQNGRLTMASVYENLAEGFELDEEAAWEALRAVGLDAEIAAMPMGLHTVVSEGGSNLSAGQRQRLLIARALAREPRLLLLDEATSALDGESQATVHAHVLGLGITRLVIAHRLSTIRSADRIVVLERGEIVEVGRFDELVAAKGAFARLMARQLPSV